MANCPLCEAVSRHFGPSTARYVNTFIDYQGGALRASALTAVDLSLWIAGGPK